MTYKGNFAALTGTEREALEDVLRAGSRLSNTAFNLSQAVGCALEKVHADSLRTSYKAWDDATTRLRLAMDKSRKRTIAGRTPSSPELQNPPAKLDAVGIKVCKATMETH